MKRITYRRIQINKSLLKMNSLDSDDLIQGSESDTFPKGVITGIYFLSYMKDDSCCEPEKFIGGKEDLEPSSKLPKLNLSHTNIKIEDTQSRLITHPSDITDYIRTNWNATGNKDLNFPINENERVIINYETIAGKPICGEFIFVIEQENCAC